MSFKTDLARGQRGEELFLAANPHLIRTDGKKGDFIHPDTKDIWELKTDFYDMQKTPNLFMERYSNIDKGTPGGVWQAAANGAKIFIYFFVLNGCYFIFDTHILITRLETLICGMKPKTVHNKSWQTVGFAVPRKALADIYTEVKIKKGTV